MGSFGRFSGGKEDGIETTLKGGRVKDIKVSPEKGKKRIVTQEKSGNRNTFMVDIPFKEAKEIERKKAYDFKVYEKTLDEDRPGGMSRKKVGGIKHFSCDERPELYTTGNKSQFKDFGSDDRPKSGRLRF